MPDPDKLGKTYRIIRYYAHRRAQAQKVIKRGLTLAQAKAHCDDPTTRKPGEWFDGYTEETKK